MSKSQSPANPQAFDLGALGYLVCLSPTQGVRVVPHPVVILDRSGSMGEMSSDIVNRALPRILRGAGYSTNDTVDLIMFDSFTTPATVPIRELGSVDACARNCTKIAPVFAMLQGILDTRERVSILCISDGDIQDTEACIVAAKKLRANDNCSVTSVSVRLGHGEADTRALMCVAQVANAATPRLTRADDVRAMEKLVQPLMMHPMAATLEGVGLRMLPGDSPRTKVQLPVGEETMLLVESLEGLMLNGTRVTPAVVELHDVSQVASYLQASLVRLRVMAVANTDAPRLLATLDCFEQLRAQLAGNAGLGRDATVHERVKLLRAQINKRRGDLLMQIAQLRNQDSVAKLNSAQKAALVNGTLDTTKSAAKALARRVGDDVDFDEQLRRDLQKLATLNVARDQAVAETSYISMDSLAEMLQQTKALMDQIEELTVLDVLPILGGIGIGYSAEPQGPLPDPWAFRVAHVQMGPFLLSEADVIIARLRDEAVEYPAQGGAVSGVVPIRSAGPAAFVVYNSPAGRGIQALHTSLSMRGCVAPVPYDVLARNSAVWFQACQQPAGERGRQVVEALADVVREAMTSYARDNLQPLREALCCPDPRPYLTGDLGVSGFLKPLAVLALGCADLPLEQQQRAMRAIYSMATFRAFPRDQDRATFLWHALGLNCITLPELAPPFQPDEAYVPNFELGAVGEVPWTPDAAALAMPLGLGDAYGMDPGQMRSWAVLQAGCCRSEADLVDKDARQSLWPEFTDTVAWTARIQQVANDALMDKHCQRLAAKAAEETELRLANLVDKLVLAPFGEFVSLINGSDPLLGSIPNHGAPGFSTLQQRLLATPCKHRKSKIALVVLGRGKDMEVAWANGNVLVASPATFRQYESAYIECGGNWDLLIATRRGYSRRSYRPGKANRHGHSDHKPSYFAYGFDSLAAYKAGCTIAEFAEYSTVHKGCCGL